MDKPRKSLPLINGLVNKLVEDVWEIYHLPLKRSIPILHARGHSLSDVAEIFGMSEMSVRRICPELSWKQRLSSSKKGDK